MAAGNRLGDDLAWGAKAIGEEIGVNQRQATYMCARKLIPAFKQGLVWCAFKSKLREHFHERAEGADA